MYNVIIYQYHMEPRYHVVLIVQEWVLKETLVILLVTMVITLLVMKIGSVRVMGPGVVLKPCVAKVMINLKVIVRTYTNYFAI